MPAMSLKRGKGLVSEYGRNKRPVDEIPDRPKKDGRSFLNDQHENKRCQEGGGEKKQRRWEAM